MSSNTYTNVSNQPPQQLQYYGITRSRSRQRSNGGDSRANNQYLFRNNRFIPPQNNRYIPRLRNLPRNYYQNFQNGYRRLYREKIYYNRYYQPPQQYYQQHIKRRSSQNRLNKRRPSLIRTQQRGPRQLKLNDFMPTELRSRSTSLPSDFNLQNNTNPAPPDALPQRARFINNTTQPFVVNNQNNTARTTDSYQQRKITTASFRRQQKRNYPQQNRKNSISTNNTNRFALLAGADDNETSDIESNIDDNKPVVVLENNKNKNKNNKKKDKKNKVYAYLQNNRILAWLKDDLSLSEIIKGLGNQAYQQYLKLGIEKKHWAKDVVKRTKKRDDIENTRFIQKKISQLSSSIAELWASISDLQIQLATYWSQVPKRTSKRTDTNNQVVNQTQTPVLTTTTTAQPISTTTANTTTPIMSPERIRSEIDKIEEAILKYIQHCTQHIKKLADNRIRLAKAEIDEFKALEDFEQIATPAQ
ncbi:unnamed protein product [Rotaria sp. Silwood1]|nr:unnamed protein product [Rotaria sp. Silwood1]